MDDYTYESDSGYSDMQWDYSDSGYSAYSPESDYSYGVEVEFPDGTTQVDPYTDAEGYVYETQQDWIDGTDQFEVQPSHDSYAYSE